MDETILGKYEFSIAVSLVWLMEIWFIFLTTGAAGGLLEVPSRSRLTLLSANGSSTLFAGISEGEIGKWLISRLLS